MNLRTVVLGFLALLSLCAAIALQAVFVRELFSQIAWGVTALLAVLWLFFNRASVLAFLTKKSTRYGANVALILFLVLGILVFINVIAKQHSWRKDVTRTGANTLSAQSQKVVRELTDDIKVFYFNNINEKEKGDDLFKRYADFSKRFKYEFVDVARFPTRAQAMGVDRLGRVVLQIGDTNKKVMADSATEEQVTNGLIKLLRNKTTAVYFTAGHDEHSFEATENPMGFSTLKALLERQGYSVKNLNLYNEGKIPADAAVVVVGGAKKAFTPKELEVLGGWIKGGGHTMIAVDLSIEEGGLAKGSRQVANLLATYGIQVGNEMLVDPISKSVHGEPQVLLGFSASREHPITRDFEQAANRANFLVPLTTYLTHNDQSPFQITTLAFTSASAWAESDWNSIRGGQVTMNPAADRRGPMDLALALESRPDPKAKEKSGPKFVVFANAIFASNGVIDKVGNRDLVLNAMAWLADDDRFISIRESAEPDAVKPFNASTINLILLFTAFVFPLLMVGAAARIWWRRSKL